MQANNEQFMERMNAVDSKIRAYARFFAFKAQILEAEDLYQEAMLKLYERFCCEPEFLNNTNSYIWCYAAWMMKNALNHEHNMYVRRVVDLENTKGEIQYTYLTGYIPRPESEAIRSEVYGIADQMPEQYRIIFDATVSGYEPEEIAYHLGITKYALKWRKHHLIQTLNKAWRTPVKDREKIIQHMEHWRSVQNTGLHPDLKTETMVSFEVTPPLGPEPSY